MDGDTHPEQANVWGLWWKLHTHLHQHRVYYSLPTSQTVQAAFPLASAARALRQAAVPGCAWKLALRRVPTVQCGVLLAQYGFAIPQHTRVDCAPVASHPHRVPGWQNPVHLPSYAAYVQRACVSVLDTTTLQQTLWVRHMHYQSNHGVSVQTHSPALLPHENSVHDLIHMPCPPPLFVISVWEQCDSVHSRLHQTEL